MEIEKTYWAVIVDGSPCCLSVNRWRHDVDLNVMVVDGRLSHCNCGWCGQRVSDDINPLDFGFEYDDNPDVKYEYEGMVYAGKAWGKKAQVKE